MGRQVEFHALPGDIRKLLQFIQQRDPVIVTLRDSDSPEVRALLDPSSETNVLTLWNQDLVTNLKRTHIVVPGHEYYSFDRSLPVLELSPSRFCEWNKRQALLSARIYGTFDSQVPRLEKWYNALVRWIRMHFVKSPIPQILHIGPAAYEWYRKGGLLIAASGVRFNAASDAASSGTNADEAHGAFMNSPVLRPDERLIRVACSKDRDAGKALADLPGATDIVIYSSSEPQEAADAHAAGGRGQGVAQNEYWSMLSRPREGRILGVLGSSFLLSRVLTG